MFQEKVGQLLSTISSTRDINKEDFALWCYTQHLKKIQVNQLQFDRISLLDGNTAFIIRSPRAYDDAYSKLWISLKNTMPFSYENLECSPLEILGAAINCIQVLKGVQEQEVRKDIADIKTSLDSEDKSSPIMWNYDTCIVFYYKLWNLVRCSMPSTYQNLLFLPPQIFCGAIDCIKMLVSKQEAEFQKITVNIKNITDPPGNLSFTKRSFQEFAEAFYELWKVLRSIPDIYGIYDYPTRCCLKAMFSPSNILCSAIDCIKVLKSMQVIAVTDAPEEEYDPMLLFKRLGDQMTERDVDGVGFLEFLEQIEMETKPYKEENKELPEFRTSSPLSRPEKKQATSSSANINITLYNEGKSFPLMWKYPDYVEAYYEIWTLLKDTMPLAYGKLIFSPFHILYGAIDCIQKLKMKQKDEFQKIFADIETTLCSGDPVVERCQKRIDTYFELWKEIKIKMPFKYGNLRFKPLYIDHAVAECAKRGFRLTNTD